MKSSFVELDQRGTNYVRGELAATNRLGRMVLSNVDLWKGSVFALVPEQHAPDIYAFRNPIFTRQDRERMVVPGGYIEPVPSTAERLVRCIEHLLNTNPHRIFVCESYLLRARDLPKVSDLPLRTTAIGEFVYHWALAGDPTNDTAAAVSMVYPVPLGFGMIGFPRTGTAGFSSSDIGAASELSAFASSAELVVVGAYDGESVVLWSKESALISAAEDLR